MIFGVGTHISVSNRDPSIEVLKDLRAQSIRDEILWGEIETVKDVFTLKPSSYAKLEAWRSVGRDNVAILNYGNALYGIGQPYTPAERDLFVQYVRFIVQIIAPYCKYIEIWNEWSQGGGRSAAQVASDAWGGAPEYVALCAAVSPIIRQLAPNSILLVGFYQKSFFDSIMDAGILNYADAFSFHMYNYDTVDPTPEDALGRLKNVNSWILAKNGGNPVGLYVTEVGWPTNTVGTTVIHPAAKVATFLSRFYGSGEKLPWIKGVWWYDLADDGPNPLEEQDRFGLVANDQRTPKPAYYTFKALTHRDRTDQYGWCRVAVTTAVEAQINAGTLSDRVARALKDLRSAGTTVVVGARPPLRVMSGPVDLAALADVGEALVEDFVIIEGPVVRGQIPAQTTATRTPTWPNGWS